MFYVQTSVDEFKQRTESKLRDVVCPVHRQTPRLKFTGGSLKDVNIQMSACCRRLIELANRRIAEK
jgi:hypothetical protein